jgi:hypothetical protein
VWRYLGAQTGGKSLLISYEILEMEKKIEWKA